MINYMTMTPQESEEFKYHFALHDIADLVLQYGYDKVMADLSEIINDRLDRLEPVREIEL